MTRAPLVLLALLLAACTAGEELPADLAAPGEPLVWPQPPEKARIKFLYAFREPQHLGIPTPFLERLWTFIAGEEPRGMVRPYAVAAEGQRLAVADPGLRVVHLYDLEDEDYERIRKVGDGFLRSPVAVAFAPGRIYVADSALGKVFAFDTDGDLLATIAGLERPAGLAYDQGSGRLYVADALGHGISVFDAAGKKLFSFGARGPETGEFNYPTHLFLRAGRLYVNDTMNFRLQVFDLEGRPIAAFGSHGDGSGDFAQPKGVGVDGEGHVYVADAVFDRVQIFDPDGRYLLTFGGTGAKVGEFWLPGGPFLAGDLIYVADSYNRRVQVFQFLGGS
jgi:DNA-binding beta-propeller fold protein YncE